MHRRVKLIGLLLPLLALSATLIRATDIDLLLDGNVGDLKHLPAQTRQGHDFTFVRLMYTARLPGHIKYWYPG